MIAEILGLNTDLAMTGAIGHDIGYLPFGHDGEIALSEILGREIRHAAVGVQIATEVERSGEGLGLTPPTLEAIQNHSCTYTSLCCNGTTPESAVVMIADKISYTFADVNDIERCMGSNDNIMRVKIRANQFGTNQRQRVATCIEALVQESAEKGFVSFSDSDCAIQFAKFRKYMFENIYFPKGPSRRIVIEGLKKAFELLETLYQG